MKRQNSKYAELQKRIGHQFKDENLLNRALVHASLRPVHDEDNEKMEFIGDRVLGLVIAEHLFSWHDLAVGEMARRLGYLVSRDVCADITRKLALFEYAQLASGIRKDPQGHLAVYANMCEALIAAIYLDGGLEAARRFIKEFWQPALDDDNFESSKNALQEAVQARGASAPTYKVISHSGPDHAPTFIVEVDAPPLGMARGKGSSRQSAEKDAACQLLTRVGKDSKDSKASKDNRD